MRPYRGHRNHRRRRRRPRPRRHLQPETISHRQTRSLSAEKHTKGTIEDEYGPSSSSSASWAGA